MTETPDTPRVPADGRTLRVRLAGHDTSDRDLTDVVQQLDADEDIDPQPDPVLRVESLTTLGRVFRETNIELLEAIATAHPESIRALARAVDRGPKAVMQNLNELEQYGLVAFERDGRAKRPYLPYDEIDIQLPFVQLDGQRSAVESSA